MTQSAETNWEPSVLSAEDVMENGSPVGLANAIRNGDEAAFNVFYDRYADRLYRYLFAILPRQEALVRDVFQETMLRVVRYIKPMPDGKAQWNWLTRVARTALYDQLRRRRRQTNRDLTHGRDLHPDEWPDDEEADTRLHAALRTALDELDPHDRELVEAYYFRGQSQSEIGSACHTTRKGIESRLARIRGALRGRLQDILHHER